MVMRSLVKYGATLVSSVGFLFIFSDLFFMIKVFNGLGNLIGITYFAGCLMALGEEKTAMHDRWSESEVVVKS